MRESFSHRNAPVCALLVISAGFLISSCAENVAFADDESIKTLSTPPPPHRFGERGDVVLPIAGVAFGTGLSNLGVYSIGPVAFYYSSSPDPGGGRDTSSSFSFDPTADFFVARHLSIGGSILVGYSNTSYTPPPNADPTTTSPASSQGQISLGLLPRIGYAIPVSEHFSIWPRVGGGMIAVDNTGTSPAPPPTPFEFRGSADLSFIYHIDKTFFVSVAPGLNVGGAPKTTDAQSEFDLSFGTAATLGFVL
jgi:hypothetical protein